jgi:hypothetical protein
MVRGSWPALHGCLEATLGSTGQGTRASGHGVTLALARVAPLLGHRPGSGRRSHGDGSTAGNTRSTSPDAAIRVCPRDRADPDRQRLQSV